MTVSELITELSRYPGNVSVFGYEEARDSKNQIVNVAYEEAESEEDSRVVIYPYA